MAIHIINHQKVDLTDNEWNLYQKICKSYDSPTNRGSDLFLDLFGSNDKGIITFLKPPSTRHTSLEIYLFLLTVQQQQYLRLMQQEVDDTCQQIKAKMQEIDERLTKLET